MGEELWHFVEARRDDGAASMFRIRELDARPELPKIFVVELPYATTELSRLPSPTGHRRLAEFEEAWLRPACTVLGWDLVGTKTEDGSCFYYLYGPSGPAPMVEKLAPFDAALGFYDDDDPGWSEYATLRELLEQARAIPDHDHDHESPPAATKKQPRRKAKVPIKSQRRKKAKTRR